MRILPIDARFARIGDKACRAWYERTVDGKAVAEIEKPPAEHATKPSP